MTTTTDPTTLTGVQWRVTWRRRCWSPTSDSKTRTFTRRPDLDRFVAKLEDHAGWGLSPAEISISWRQVGPWQPAP